MGKDEAAFSRWNEKASELHYARQLYQLTQEKATFQPAVLKRRMREHAP
jgi:hypothetical protein